MDLKIPGSIFGMILILGLVLFPGYMVEKLEQIETSEEGILTLEEIQSSNSTSTTYNSYVQFNETTAVTITHSGTFEDGTYWRNSGTSTNHDNTGFSYDTPGSLDSSICPFGTASDTYFYICMEVDANDLLTDNVDEFSLYIDSDETYEIMGIYWFLINADGSYGSSDSWSGYPSTWTTSPSTGSTYYNWTISSTELNQGATLHTGSYTYMMRPVILFSGITDEAVIYHDLKINPEYFESTETTWNNQTVTTYEPYIQTISNPYTIQYYVMGIAGILMIGIALIISPLVDPSTWFKGGKR